MVEANILAHGSNPHVKIVGLIENPAGSTLDYVRDKLYSGNYTYCTVDKTITDSTYWGLGIGLVANRGNIGSIVSDFVNNRVEVNLSNSTGSNTLNMTVLGGAISNVTNAYASSSASIDNIEGNFIGNYLFVTAGSGTTAANYGGGAISNYAFGSTVSVINNIKGNFIGKIFE